MKTYEELKAENEAQAKMIIKLRDQLTIAISQMDKKDKMREQAEILHNKNKRK